MSTKGVSKIGHLGTEHRARIGTDGVLTLSSVLEDGDGNPVVVTKDVDGRVTLSISDIVSRSLQADLLNEILIELKFVRMHLESITGETFDVSDFLGE